MLIEFIFAAAPTVMPPQAVMPVWWEYWKQLPTFSSPFIQESESATFGKLTRKGNILAARGGRLRVEYEKGVLLLCDGTQLTQYDPSTRTAIRHDLDSISEEWPLLRILTEPARLSQAFHISLQNNGIIKLTPKSAGLPEVMLEGKGSFLHRATWLDGTGAKQVLTLTSIKTPPDPGKGPFAFKLPKGAKMVR